jgi:hypothetical protein
MTAFEEINGRLNDASRRRDALLRARARFAALEHALAAAQQQLDEQNRILEREQKEYERLEGKSLHSVFYSILGNREKQLEKERQEYLTALLKRDEAAARVSAIESDRSTLINEARA